MSRGKRDLSVCCSFRLVTKYMDMHPAIRRSLVHPRAPQKLNLSVFCCALWHLLFTLVCVFLHFPLPFLSFSSPCFWSHTQLQALLNLPPQSMLSPTSSHFLHMPLHFNGISSHPRPFPMHVLTEVKPVTVFWLYFTIFFIEIGCVHGSCLKLRLNHSSAWIHFPAPHICSGSISGLDFHSC